MKRTITVFSVARKAFREHFPYAQAISFQHNLELAALVGFLIQKSIAEVDVTIAEIGTELSRGPHGFFKFHTARVQAMYGLAGTLECQKELGPIAKRSATMR
jgi:hypothetical protein